MAGLTEAACPNCGAPMTVSTSQCSSCKIYVVAAADEGGPEPPRVVIQGRSERLGGMLRSEKMQALWREAGPAWA